METKNTSSSGSVLEEPEIQKLQMPQRKEAFHRLFDANEGLFRSVLSRNMQNLEMQFSNETLHEKDSNSELRAIKGQFEHYHIIQDVRAFQEVSPDESSSTSQPLEQVQNYDENDVFANVDQNATECVDERAALANLIANLTLDTEENKTVLKQLKKANASLTQELEKCKTNLDETNSALGEAISCRDSCLIALQNKQNEFEKYKAFNDRTIDYEILQTKLNETLGLLALKDIEIKEGHNWKVISKRTQRSFHLKVKEEEVFDKMIEMDKQLKFLNEIVYTRNQSIQTIHMLAPKCATYNGRLTFANPRYLKKAQSEKPCLYEIPYDTSDPANRFAPDREDPWTLITTSRSKIRERNSETIRTTLDR
ncbi:hypothetical protein Tco_1135484 [Tanacetum coccineum]